VTRHRVEMPATPRPWTCACTATATLPLAASWAAWEASVADHLHLPAPCPECGMTCRSGAGLAAHRRHHHPNGKATP